MSDFPMCLSDEKYRIPIQLQFSAVKLMVSIWLDLNYVVALVPFDDWAVEVTPEIMAICWYYIKRYDYVDTYPPHA